MAEVRRVIAEAKELNHAADGALTDNLAHLALFPRRLRPVEAGDTGISHPYGQPAVLHPRYLDFARHYGFTIKACGPKKPCITSSRTSWLACNSAAWRPSMPPPVAGRSGAGGRSSPPRQLDMIMAILPK